MKIVQIYTGCLAQGAYYVESEGEVAIIDPLREVKTYIDKAQRNNAKIKYIFETHYHADFVSGHIDLAEKTGAQIIYGPLANPSFKAIEAVDGQIFRLGKLQIKVLHTPGHTLESTCYLLFDENGKEHALFSGDTLFIGDVGRPDLAQNGKITMEDLASKLYHSLHDKIMTLTDELLVYPAHGAGSACGKNMSKETFDTLGNQKKVNYALQNIPESQFIKEVTEGLLPPPFYFPENVALNKKGAKSIDTVIKTGLIPLSPDEFEKIANAELALIIDTRHHDDFEKGFIPNSIFIGINGDFAPWVGTLVTDIKQPILIIADIGAEKEVITRLARVGYDYTLGYLDGGFESWIKAGKEIDTIKSIDASDLSNLLGTNDHILDVRKEAEFDIEHVKIAQNIPLANISEFMEDVSHENTNFVHCAGGYRSMVATSILKARGIDNVVNVKGGFGAIKEHSDLAII